MKKWLTLLALSAGLFSVNATADTWYNKFRDGRDIPFTQNGTGAVVSNLNDEAAARVSVTQFGVKCDGSTNDTTALAKVKTYLDGLESGSKKLPAVHFPAGTCLFTQFPNLAFNNLILQADGEVRLRLTSSSAISTVSIDGSVKGGVTNMKMLGRWIIEGPSTSAYGLAITQVHHSKFEATCRGAGTASSCFYNAFTVANNYHYTCSNNEPGGFYSKPFYCLLVTSYGGNKSGFDTYYTPIFEGVSVGISLLHSLGSTFIGGTSEGHSIGGVQFGTDSNLNKFIGTDFEENGTYDAYIEGDDNELNTVNTQTKVQVVGTATNTRIVGGHHWAIQVDTGALRTRITDALYNVANNGSTLSDLGTGTILLNTTNQGTGVTTNTPGKTDKANTWASAQTFSVAPVLSTITGLVKGNGASAVTAAVSGTDYAPATSGTSILKGNGSGGFSAAVSNTDYAPVASPAFSGAPTAPTQTALDNSTKLATTAYVDAAAPQAAWSSVTPTVTWTGGTPTGWSISARYREMGKTVDYAWTLTEGTALNGATSVTIGTPSGLLLQSNTALMCQDIFDSTIYTSYGAAGAAETNFYSVAANHVLVCNGTFEVQ